MPEDPTGSEKQRDRWERKFAKRWRTLRGDVRRELEGGSDFRPQNDVSIATQASRFREWFEARANERVADPLPTRAAVERGDHYTANAVREFYTHGLRRASDELRAAGYDVPEIPPDRILVQDRWRDGPHTEWLTENYTEAYDDVVDAVRATVTDSSRAYRQAARNAAPVATTIAAVQGPIRKIGETRTDLVAQSKGIGTINDAALTRYTEFGVEEVGVDIELRVGGEDVTGVEDFESEWETAGDDRVCDECWDIAAGGPYPIADIRNGVAPMPVRDTHPGCRCFLTPVPKSALTRA